MAKKSAGKAKSDPPVEETKPTEAAPRRSSSLVDTPDNGVAWIVQDNLLNTYDRAGGAYSNFKP